MPRPHEIAADARALYGPLALRPSAQEAGDGALWVDPSAQSPLSHVQSGNWMPLGPAGVPVLHGPYVVDYTDIPHDGDTKALWTPQVGDVLLRLFPDWHTVTQWDHGTLYVGQNPNAEVYPARNVFDSAGPGDIGTAGSQGLDSFFTATSGQIFSATGAQVYSTAYVFPSTVPVSVQLVNTSGTDDTQGHVDLYALVARAVAP